MKRLPLIVALLALAPASALAEKAEPSPMFAAFEDHRLSVYLRTGGDLYTSDSRTAGGIGGGVGVRDTWKERFLFQLDASYLFALSNVVALRGAAGVQKQGLYAPAALLTFTAFLGGAIEFSLPGNRHTPTLPPLVLGLSVAPARFLWKGVQVSAFELGAGLGYEFPGVGIGWHASLLELSAEFD